MNIATCVLLIGFVCLAAAFVGTRFWKKAIDGNPYANGSFMFLELGVIVAGAIGITFPIFGAILLVAPNFLG